MKIVIVDTYYPQYLIDFYQASDLSALSYTEQKRKLLDTCFGTSDFYSRHLVKAGFDAQEIIANCVPLQLSWARENGFRALPLIGNLPQRLTNQPLAARLLRSVIRPILAEQVARLRPDVLYMQDLTICPPDFLRSLKRHVKLLVGQTATALPPARYLAPYDLLLSSFPHFIPKFREMGIAAEYFRLGFDASILDRVGREAKRYACTFVGGISPAHKGNMPFLERIAADTDFFGYGVDMTAPGSLIRRRHHGEVWGLDMYRALAQSHITINRHAEIAQGKANNMRLYEATGMGAMLLTDAQSDLGDFFEIGKEVVAYDNADHAVEMIRHYSKHPDERDAIARAGQARTLRDHSYQRRMEQLVEILKRKLGG